MADQVIVKGVLPPTSGIVIADDVVLNAVPSVLRHGRYLILTLVMLIT